MMLECTARIAKPNWTMRPVLSAVISGSALVLIAMTPIVAQQTARDGVNPASSPTQFDIPAQPLADALYMYSSRTGLEVLVPSEMLANRRSSAVTGTLAPGDALHALLSGTGLAPRSTGAGAFTLTIASPDPSFPIGRLPRYPEYSAALQSAVTQVLCQLRETRPGGYRVAARLWVGRTGEVTQVDLLGTTGDPGRDAALAGLFRHVILSEPPPVQLPQPTTVVVLPRQDARDCATGGGHPP
jgi:hypothetical protein